MKNFNCLLFFSFILFSSCSEDEGTNAQHEFSSYLVNEILITNYAYDETSNSYEIGWVFDSDDGGKVVELGGLFPEAGVYTVTLWDAGTGAILAQTDVSATSGVLAMKKITAVTLEPGKDYVVSFNTYLERNYYWLDPAVSIYPLALNDITVYGEVEISTSSATSLFPQTGVTKTIAGVPEIGFVKN